MISLLRGFNNLDFSNDRDLESPIVIPNSSAFRNHIRNNYSDRDSEGATYGAFSLEAQDVIAIDITNPRNLIQVDRFNLNFVRQDCGVFESEMFTQIKDNAKKLSDLNSVFVRLVQKAITYTLDVAEENAAYKTAKCSSFSLTFDWTIETDAQSVRFFPQEYLIVPIIGNTGGISKPYFGDDAEYDLGYTAKTKTILSAVNGFNLYSRVNYEN